MFSPNKANSLQEGLHDNSFRGNEVKRNALVYLDEAIYITTSVVNEVKRSAYLHLAEPKSKGEAAPDTGDFAKTFSQDQEQIPAQEQEERYHPEINASFDEKTRWKLSVRVSCITFLALLLIRR